jgi:hypothetical protein
MKKGIFTALLLLSTQLFSAPAPDQLADYRAALQKELDNRALAGRVVTALAKHHQGTPQGDFWSAYSTLETRQWARYSEYGERHELTAGLLFIWFNAQTSILFAKAFPERFIATLANATAVYASKLETVSPPETDRVFWNYVIDQEHAQATAFDQALNSDFKSARHTLEAFVEAAWGKR